MVGIYTKAPSDTLTWNAEVTTGIIDSSTDASMLRVKGGVSGPLTDTLRGSLGFAYNYNEETQLQALEGGIGEDGNELDRYSIRGQLHWDITDSLDARLILAAVSRDDKNGSSDIFYDPDGFLPVILDTFQAFGVSTPCTDNDPRNRIGCSRLANKTDFESYEATLILNYAMANDWTMTSITSWDWFEIKLTADDVAQVSAPILRFHDTQESESFQQELRFTSPGGKTVDWLGGFFYYTNQFNRGDSGKRPIFLSDSMSAHPAVAAIHQILLGIPIPAATPGQLGFLDGYQETDYIGIFGQATWNISDRFSVTAGVRWQEEEKTAGLKQWVNDHSPSVISLLLSPSAVGGVFKRDTDEYIKQPHRNLHEITFLLGFTASSSFSRAFKRWTGVSPSEFQQ